MAEIHYEGLDGWWKSAALWGALGVIIAFANLPPWLWMVIAIVAGAATGGASAFWLSKMKTKAMSITGWIGLLVFAGLIYLLTISNPATRVPTMGFFALGCLFQSANMLVFGIAGTRAIKVLNEKNAGWLSKLGASSKRVGPPPPAPPAADYDACRTKLLAALPEPLRSDIANAFQTVTLATPFRSLQSISPAASSLSGAPLLDPAFAWPHLHGQPLEFLAQLNLGEIPDTGHARPAAGLISFFCDVANQPWGHDADDVGKTVVLFTPDPSNAHPLLKPGTPPHAPPRKPLAFTRTPAFCLTEDQTDRLDDFIQETDEATAYTASDMQMTLGEANPPESNRVLCAPSRVQGDMDDDLAKAARFLGLPLDTGWTLLLQLDSDRDLGWCWGDNGFLYFWIPTADLAEGRFNRVWTILQCC
ncbi:YwqG family protein [Luteolibacter soli]|uniref:YwqG family protein n=1 Tax=Luteolibacter soli TaxID=3135280 RepID=A0ABU9ANV0_9BACT